MHTHPHPHPHGHDIPGSRVFALGIALNLTFAIVELAAGGLVHSLALASDAVHNLGDVMAIAVAWGATRLARQAPTPRRTYGMRRGTILAALGNGVVLLLGVGALGWNALQRLAHPQPVPGGVMAAVAGVGIVVNGTTALLFRGGRADVNVRAAFLHMLADAAASAGVVAAGLVMMRTGAAWLDPSVSLAICAVIALGTWRLLAEALELAMDVVPRGIAPEEVEAFLCAQPGIAAVHDLHIWAMSTTESALTVHLVRPEGATSDAELERLQHELQRRFGIGHITIQTERGDADGGCRQADREVV
ncbi:MAG TPA: cation diffusion facilitator family transporter [Candidatus Eisenbacteria bacterium]|nr:cation diffusion facilitator family transporter [Candidatus Eisenbacteria bacterium]